MIRKENTFLATNCEFLVYVAATETISGKDEPKTTHHVVFYIYHSLKCLKHVIPWLSVLLDDY